MAAPGPAPSSAPAPRRIRRPGGKRLKWIIAAIVLVVGCFFGLRYWHESSLYESADNAYVGANQVEVTAQITGTVVRVYVRDQQHVKAGDPLFDIDPANYRLAVSKAPAALELARQGTTQLSAGVASAQAALALIAAQIAQESLMNAMLDAFKLTAWSFVLMLPLVFIMRSGRPGGTPRPPAVADAH